MTSWKVGDQFSRCKRWNGISGVVEFTRPDEVVEREIQTSFLCFSVCGLLSSPSWELQQFASPSPEEVLNGPTA